MIRFIQCLSWVHGNRPLVSRILRNGQEFNQGVWFLLTIFGWGFAIYDLQRPGGGYYWIENPMTGRNWRTATSGISIGKFAVEW